ncbi:MAG: long-chain fatty acid--CoA ligase [Flavobacteriales bacterium]|nr:long-chain fatty acid--CoA ligase [Flavobacteriales bacterium]
MSIDLTKGRLFDFIAYQLKEFPQDVSVGTKTKDGWKTLSTRELYDISHRLGAGLVSKGIAPNDKVAIISTTNRHEWNIIDLAVLQIGAIDVPVYPTITEKDYEYILNDSECRLAFVSDIELYRKLKSIQSVCPKLEGIYIMDQDSDAPHWSTLMEGDIEKSHDIVDPLKENVKHEDLATLIYTSGTTGVPKGVMLSHRNIVSNVLASAERLPASPGYKALSFLPLCHIFERMLIYLYAYKGTNIYYAESLETIGDDLKEVKPDIFTAVPRLLEKVYGKIMAKGDDLTGIKRKLFFWAVKLAERFEYYGENGAWYEFKLKIARKLIFSKWQEALGGNVKLAASGSAALSPRLSRIYNAAGIPIMEGYGLTETSPVVSVNEKDNRGFKFGTTGRPIRGVEVKIAEDGEILVKGPNLMMGYYNKPEQTAQVIDQDGWFHTGDIGELVDGEFLKITDRKKEIFKTSGGKYIAPQIMENVFKQNKFVEQLIVLGENKKHPSALIVPSFENLLEECEEMGVDTSDLSKTLSDPKVIDLYNKVLEKCNSGFARWEKIKKYILLPKEFTIEGGELTPTLKLKRKAIHSKYASQIEELYDEI